MKSNVLIVLFTDQLHKHDEFKAYVESGYFHLALCFGMTSYHLRYFSLQMMPWLVAICYLWLKLQPTIQNALVAFFRFSRVSWNKTTTAKWFHSLIPEQQKHFLLCFYNILFFFWNLSLSQQENQTTWTPKHHRQELEGWLKAEQGCWEMLEVNTSPQGSSVGIFQALGYRNSLKIFWEQAQTIQIGNLLSPTFITATQTHKFRVHFLALLQTLPYLHFSSQQWSLAPGGHPPSPPASWRWLHWWPPDTSKKNYDHVRVFISL